MYPILQMGICLFCSQQRFCWVSISGAGSGASKMQDPENWNTAGTSLEPRWNPAGTLLEPRCWNLAGMSLECRWNVGGTLLEPRWKIAGTFWNTLLECCWNVAGTLLEPRWSLAGKLRKSETLLEPRWNPVAGTPGWNIFLGTVFLFILFLALLIVPGCDVGSLARTLLEQFCNHAGTYILYEGNFCIFFGFPFAS